jgi:hypothetical protein
VDCAPRSKLWSTPLGDTVGFHLTGGKVHDLIEADQLLPDMQADTMIADEAFDADNRVIEPLAPYSSRCTPRRRMTPSG